MHQQQSEVIVCLDIGGTNIRGCYFSRGERGEIKLCKRPHHRDATLRAVKEMITHLTREAGGKMCAIGIASAGPLDREHKRYLHTVNMPELNMFPLGRFIEKAFGVPCIMENDAQAACMGEFHNRPEKQVQDLVLITLGTGVGTGVVMGGKLWRAAHITGPELGHLFLGGDRRCGCGQRGCAETLLNSRALGEIAYEVLGERLSASRVISLAPKGGEKMEEIWKIYGRRLGKFLCILQTIFGIKEVCISGGISRLFPYIERYIWEVLEEEMELRRWWLPRRIYPSTNPHMSALYGMFHLIREGEGLCS